MIYTDALPLLRSSRVILVTGPQRSGTTIAARCLAADLDLPFLPEEVFGTDSFRHFFALMAGLVSGVVQAPAMSSVCHKLASNVAVVWMTRPLGEIIASQERIDWQSEPWELMQYFLPPTNGPVASAKYLAWRAYQKPLVNLTVELEYASLCGHRLWVEGRSRFGARQTSGTP